MSHYIISKEQLVNFYKENVKTQSLLPSYHATPNQMKRISKIFRFNYITQIDLVKELQVGHRYIVENFSVNLKEKLEEAFAYIKNNPMDEKAIQLSKIIEKNNFLEVEDKENLKKYLKISNENNLDFISAIEEITTTNLFSENNNEYVEKNVEFHFGANIIHSYLFTQEKIDNFYRVINFLDNKIQSSIININFGNDEEMLLDPILNINGLNQAFVAPYIDVDNFIIYSDSPLYIIEQTIGKVQIPTKEDIMQIMEDEAKLEYISFSMIDNFENLISNNEITHKDLDIFEETLLKIKSDTPPSITEFFPILINICEKYTLEKLAITHQPTLKSFFLYIEEKASANPEEFQEQYLIQIQKLFQEKKYDLLKLFSPLSSNLINIFNNNLNIDFVEKLLTHVNIVQAAHLYFKNDQNSQLYEYIINITDNDIDKGISKNINEYSYLTKNGQQIIEEILIKIKNKDPNIFTQFKEDISFNSIQQDIYPLLGLADKLNYNNYSCFYENVDSENKFNHLTSLPLVLYDDKILVNNFFKRLEKIDSYKNNILEVYAPKILEYTINNKLHEALKNNEYLDIIPSFLKFRKVGETAIKNIIEQDKEFKFINNIFLQIENNKDDQNTKDILKIVVKILFSNSLEINNIIDSTTLLKFVPFINDTNNEAISSKFLNYLCNDPKFKVDKHENIILEMYQINNEIINGTSHSELKKFFREPKIIEKIITHHKNTNTISTTKAFNLEQGFNTNSSSNICILTKSSLKKIEFLKLDLVYLSGNIIPYLSPDILNDEKMWNENIISLLNLYNEDKNSFHNFQLPIEMKKNYSLFKKIFNYSINTYENKFNRNNISSSFLSQFSKTFLNRQENILIILQTLSENFETNKDSKQHLNKISQVNHNLGNSMNNILIKCLKNKHNYFQDIIISLEHNQINRNVIININNPTKINKF